MNDLTLTFGQELRSALKAHGMKQRWFAAHLGIMESQLSRWLSDGIFPHDSSLLKVREALGEMGWDVTWIDRHVRHLCPHCGRRKR